MQTDDSKPSKLVVRHVSLNKFLSPAGHWVTSSEAASNFPNLLNAINACLGRELKDVELIMHFDGDKPAQRIPLNTIW
jgi:hypothetical protein